MTDWELETIEDFDGTFFDDGTGWKIIFQIHMAISLRAKITLHSIRAGNFATQVSGIVWTQDHEGLRGMDLPTRLGSYYTAIVALLSADANRRWTESSGRSPEWTIESLTADIGMGEFSDLMIRPQSPEPIVWLIAALDRLVYPKLLLPLVMQNFIVVPSSPVSFIYTEPETDEVESGRTAFFNTYQDAWDDMYYDEVIESSYRRIISGGIGGSPLDNALRWGSASFYGPQYKSTFSCHKFKYIALVAKSQTGIVATNTLFYKSGLSIKCIDYLCGLFTSNYTGPDWTIKIGSSPETNIGHLQVPIPPIESVGPDLDFTGDLTVTAELITARPATYPFTGGGTGNIRVRLSSAWIYCDLPEVMGVGELSAPIPTASGEAEWEE